MRNKLSSTIVITFLNNKGGVGKTSSCTAIAALLGLAGYSVLLIDNDFQANATVTLLTEADSVLGNIADIYRMSSFSQESVRGCIVHTSYSNLDLLPASAEHEGTNDYLYTQIGKKVVQKILAKAVRQIREDYDFILIDSHPDLTLVAQNALCCSDFAISPVRADGYSYQGVAPITNEILKISSDEDLNQNLKFLGVFIIDTEPRTTAFKTYRDYYTQDLGEDFIPVSIRRDSAISAVTSYLKPLPYLLGASDFDGKATRWKGLFDYIELMREVEMISDADYATLRGAFEIMKGNLRVVLSLDRPIQIQSVDSAPGSSDENPAYGNRQAMNYAELITAVNSDADVRNEIRDIILSVMAPDKTLKKVTPQGSKTVSFKVSRLMDRKE